jgi:hydroxyacylglutathione hydrolase
VERVATNEYVQVDRLRLGPFDNNSYILTCPLTGESVLVDAPGEASEILEASKGTHLRVILITHNHLDHIGAIPELKSRLRIPIGAHRLDAKGLPLRPEILLEDGEEVPFGKMSLKVLHTPGHTPGSLCFWVEKHLISGDTIFPGGPGKTHSPTDLRQIITSITSKVLVLPDVTTIWPGHGNSTILRKEKEEFAVFSSRPHDPNLFGDVLWLSS